MKEKTEGLNKDQIEEIASLKFCNNQMAEQINQISKTLGDNYVGTLAEGVVKLKADRDAPAEQVKVLREQLAESQQYTARIKEWTVQGESIYDQPLGIGFSLGKWWGERPWRLK